MKEACEKTGLNDFGENDFLPGLEQLLLTYESNNYSEKGKYKSRKRLVDLLSARLRIENAFRLHPEIRNEKISAPMFLTGLPRTGTSALLNLLAVDPDTRPLYMWEGFNPEPVEGLDAGAVDPRYQAMKEWEEQSKKDNPEFAKIHSTSADTPEECIHLLNHTFCDVQYGVETMMEPYGNWFQQQVEAREPLLTSYRYHGDLLRMLQWQRPGNRWLLKTPGHLWALDILVELYPDCSIIITHRDPLECVTSYASMMAAMMGERAFDKRELGPVVMEYLARKMEKAMVHRDTLDSSRVLDISYHDFIDDSLATAEKVYGHFDMPLTDEVRSKLESYVAVHPMNRHGKHEYDLDEYGLDRGSILSRFSAYLEKHGDVIQEG
jgi:hypothetical protein